MGAGAIIGKDSLFYGNNPQIGDSFPSVRRNIYCSGGAYVDSGLDYFLTDRREASASKWIYTGDNDCILKGDLEYYVAPTYVPTLTNASGEANEEN